MDGWHILYYSKVVGQSIRSALWLEQMLQPAQGKERGVIVRSGIPRLHSEQAQQSRGSGDNCEIATLRSEWHKAKGS